MTKRELSQLYFLNREIEQLKEQLTNLEHNIGIGAQVLSDMPRGCGLSDQVSRSAVEVADLKELIRINIEKCYYEQKKLNRFISDIPNSEIRLILTYRYINGLSWCMIANTIGEQGDGSTQRKKHDRFLRDQNIP